MGRLWLLAICPAPLLLLLPLPLPSQGVEEVEDGVARGGCVVPSNNISLISLKQPYYTAIGSDKNYSYTFYISLCSPLSDLPDGVSELCEPGANTCLTRTRLDWAGEEEGRVGGMKEEEMIRDAGSGGELHLRQNAADLTLTRDLLNGSKCTDKNGLETSTATRVTFLCNGDGEKLTYTSTISGCEYQVFWFSSLACVQPGNREPAQSGSCVVRIPGYDTIVDLGMWDRHGQGFHQARSVTRVDNSDGVPRVFHLNLCSGLLNSPCPNSAIICEVPDTEEGVKKVLVNTTTSRTVTYHEDTETISIEYGGSESPNGHAPVNLQVRCDRNAMKPEVTLVSDTENGDAYSFRFLTRAACMVPPVQCITEDSQGNIYDLSSLIQTEYEFEVSGDPGRKYQLKVCGSLAVNPDNPCINQAGVCSFKLSRETNKMTEAVNLGIMSKRPFLDSDGVLLLTYDGGDRYDDGQENICNLGTDIQLICSEKEIGPTFVEKTSCRHVLSWRTPAACPQQQVISQSCQVRETLYGHLFDLKDLYNSTHDYIVQTDKFKYVLNVCGAGLHSACTALDPDTVCLDTEEQLTYDDGSLVLLYTSQKPCPSDPTQHVSARIQFLCHHEEEVGQPELAGEEDDRGCQVNLKWMTRLACPPHDQVPCHVSTPDGEVDLSSLSLPHQNYEVGVEGKSVIVMNVCRSLVHSNQSHCLYQAAACLTSPGKVAGDSNLGMVSLGPQVDSEGKIYLAYTMGGVCRDRVSSLTHLKTTIYFTCDPASYETTPEFQELSACNYIFQWRHAAACVAKQTSQGNCTVTNPESGFTFDLSSLYRPDGEWTYVDSWHHVRPNNISLNICGPLSRASPCGEGVGLCINGKDAFGYANSNLTVYDGQLELTYSGTPCYGNSTKNSTATILINCPSNRIKSSGNREMAGPKYFRPMDAKDQCSVMMDFYSDLACDHQVYCDVMDGDIVFPLTKLRRHDINYRVTNKEKTTNFTLNICGPLVPTDVPKSRCNPQGVCGYVDGDWVGLGKVMTSPQLAANGHIQIVYEEGSLCGVKDKRWRSKIVFTCNNHTVSPIHPFGTPTHVSTDNASCENVFHFPTKLACKDVLEDYTKQETPESCHIYHPGKGKHIDITRLYKKDHYKVYDPVSQYRDVYYEIQPCGALVDKCQASICRVSSTGVESLGSFNDVQYEPNSGDVKVKYIEGDECNSQTRQKYGSKIYYKCAPWMSLNETGEPVVNTVLDCMIIFDWETRHFCDESDMENYFSQGGGSRLDTEMEVSPPEIQPLPKVHGGTVWGHVILGILVVVVVGCTVHLYRNPHSRGKALNILREIRAKMPVMLGGRGRGDSTLLVSGLGTSTGLETHSDDEEF